MLQCDIHIVEIKGNIQSSHKVIPYNEESL